jgi:hypothetical protein
MRMRQCRDVGKTGSPTAFKSAFTDDNGVYTNECTMPAFLCEQPCKRTGHGPSMARNGQTSFPSACPPLQTQTFIEGIPGPIGVSAENPKVTHPLRRINVRNVKGAFEAHDAEAALSVTGLITLLCVVLAWCSRYLDDALQEAPSPTPKCASVSTAPRHNAV